MTRRTAQVLAHYTTTPQPRERHLSWWTLGTIVALLLAIGVTIGHFTAPSGIPLCHEDEVITHAGACVPLDDADYVGGVGWERDR